MKQAYYQYKIENLLTVSKIVTVHYFEFEKDFKWYEESHDFWELVYADKESVICSREGEETELNEGEIIFHKPNEKHSLRANGKTAPNVFIVSFVCKSQSVGFFEGKKLTLDKDLKSFIYMIIEESKRVFDLPYSNPELKKMPLLNQPALGGLQMLKNLLEILLVRLMRSVNENADGNVFLMKEDYDGYIANRIIEILQDKVYQTFKIDDLQEILNYHKSYLFREFKASTGQTIMGYFIKLKISHAKKLLRETGLSITEVSEKLAFDTPNYFSKTFKRITGYTPIQYKKLHVK